MAKIDKLLTMKDLMEIIPRDKKTVRKYVEHLPVVTIGRCKYWQESVIRDFIEANTERRDT